MAAKYFQDTSCGLILIGKGSHSKDSLHSQFVTGTLLYTLKNPMVEFGVTVIFNSVFHLKVIFCMTRFSLLN